MTDLLRLEGIGKLFGGIVALDQVSFAVQRGCIQGLIGPNGAGKTTLFNVITGFYSADRGHLFLNDERCPDPATPFAMSRLGIARTFQNIRLFAQMTVRDNVLVGRFMHRGSGLLDSVLRTRRFREDEQRQLRFAEECLERMHLLHRADDVASSLSYGEQRRLEIARALATEPMLLALDEPAAGMNAQETEELGSKLEQLRREGLTLLLVEHDLPWVTRLCDRVAVLDFGRLVINDVPAVIQRHPKVLQAYLGMGET